MNSDVLLDSLAGKILDPARRPEEELTKSLDLITRWQADARTQGMARTTIVGYSWSLKEFEKFCNGKGILAVDKLQIRAYVESCRKRGLTTRTIGQRLAGLSSFYEWAVFEGLIQINPVQEIRRRYLRSYKKNPGEQHTHQLVSIQDAAKVIAITPDIRDKAILLVLFKTGIRRNELCSLEVQDINWKNQSIMLKPTAKRTNRMVFFDDECAAYLHRWLAVREYRNKRQILALWISSWGTAISGKGVADIIYVAGIKAGLHDSSSDRMEDHFSAHCCRHWFTTYLLRAGMRREYVQWLRGDAIKEAVDIYFHVDPEDVRRSYLAHIPQLGI